MAIHLRQVGLSHDVLGPYQLAYTFSVLPSTRQHRAEVTPSIPAHVRQILLSCNLPRAAFIPKGHPGPFDHTLAKGLALDRHCLPLLSALSSRKFLAMIYRLSTTKRQLLLDNFLEDFKHYGTNVIKGDTSELKYLQEQYTIARLTMTLLAPIYSLPNELLIEIFLFSVEQLGVNQTTLQQVSQTWRGLIPRLWGALQVGTWTETKGIAAVLDQRPLSLNVVIDTTVDNAHSITSKHPYAALEFAWNSTARWRSLTINSFPSNASIVSSKVSFSPHSPFNNLESLSVGPGCQSSDHINEIMEAIASTATRKLTSLKLAAKTVFQKLNHSHWAHVYSQLTVLEVNVSNVTDPVDLLRHCARLEILKLSGVISHHISPGDELPLCQTLRQLWLQHASIQWMVGRTFERLNSCAMFRPVDPHHISHASIINLPACTSVTLQSPLIHILGVFHAPIISIIKIECNEWSKSRANVELGRVWSQRRDQEMLRPKFLSLKILCADQTLLEALRQMDTLEVLVLDLRHPSALGAYFFEALCAVPSSAPTVRTLEEWIGWAHCGTKWHTKVCPSLRKLKIRYARWLRKGEMDLVSPLFVAVAWSRAKLPSPLRKFKLKLGDARILQLVGTLHWGHAFERLWRHTKVHFGDGITDSEGEMLCLISLTAAFNRSLVFVHGKSAVLFDRLGGQRYWPFLHRLRAFHHHPPSPPPHSYDILPCFEQLEELNVSNFHFEPCPSTVNLPLCRTLRILHIRNTPLGWMDGRIFNRVVACEIVVCNDVHISGLSKVEMPTCKKMEFGERKYLKLLAFFHLPSLESLLTLSPANLWPLWNTVLPIQFVRSLQPLTASKDEDLADQDLVEFSRWFIDDFQRELTVKN